MRTLVAVAAALTFLSSAALAQQSAPATPAQQTQQPPPVPTLIVGDAAPALSGGKWVKGEPVSELEKGKVYILEFWATWCVPCLETIPHVNELQKKYADQGLIVIGLNVAEREPEKVEPFVAKMGEKMDYRVVMDEPAGLEGRMLRNWLVAAGRQTIPCSVIVDRAGRIAWIGHPMQMDEPLAKIVAGEWDIEAEAETARQEVDRQRRFNEANQRLAAAMGAGKVEEALAIAEEFGQIREDLRAQVPLLKYRILGQAGRWAEAYQQASAGVDQVEDYRLLNELAWSIVSPQSLLPKKDLDVALKAAEKADRLSEGKNTAVIDTLARVHFLRGEKQKAVELQRKAVELEDDPERKARLQATLREYEQVQ